MLSGSLTKTSHLLEHSGCWEILTCFGHVESDITHLRIGRRATAGYWMFGKLTKVIGDFVVSDPSQPARSVSSARSLRNEEIRLATA